MKKVAILGLFVFLSIVATDISLSQLIKTLPLSPEEAEVIKPLEKIVEGWHKKDTELFMSAYHEKAIIEMAAGGKVNKSRLKSILNLGSVSLSYDVQKVEITGDKAVIECITTLGGRDVPRKFDMVKEKESWLIIGQWLR